MTASPDRIARESLKAQLALAPYAYAALAVGVLFLLPLALRAPEPVRLAGPLTAFIVALIATRAAQLGLAGREDLPPLTVARTQVLTGLAWSASVLALTGFAVGSGPAAEPLLLLTVGAAVLIAFFTAPHLPSLLIVAPAAAGPPLLALRWQDAPTQNLALSAVALALALCLILNRSQRRLFTLTLEHEDLTEAREAALAQAEQLARAKSALISTLSSQIRDGLAAAEQSLAGAAGARRRRSGGDPLDAALANLKELSLVVASTLDTEDAEAGRLALRPEPFDLTGLLLELLEEHRPAAAAKGLDLELSLSGPLEGAALADRARTAQALSALLANAVRYTARGRIELSAAAEGNDVRLAVSDTGPGLSPEELTRALTPFDRVERTCLGVPGAGLGLPLAARLAELLGGGLSADSAQGLGSRFSFTLPYDPTLNRTQAPAEPLPAIRLLTVGGDTLSAALLRDAAEGLGCQVVHAARPERALSLLRRAEFDAVVVDSPSEAFVSLLRAEPAAAHLPLLALIPPESDEAAAGADAALRKPVDASALARALATARRLQAEPLPDAA